MKKPYLAKVKNLNTGKTQFVDVFAYGIRWAIEEAEKAAEKLFDGARVEVVACGLSRLQKDA